ncbi:MAG: tetratricopeptide repeat protein [Cyanobacteriota/Melainabacteria group bacterium]
MQYNMANCLLHLKRYKEAIAAFQQAIKIDKSVPDTHALLASAYTSQGDFARAADELKAAISLKDDKYEWHSQLGDVQTKLKEYDGAISNYETAQKLNPQDSESCYSLGYLYQLTGKLDKAENSSSMCCASTTITQTHTTTWVS